MCTEKITFGLVHGGAHGAWCWQRVVDELAARGHRGIAMDLPCDDESASVRDYADAVVAALVDEPDPVVLVGHSLGGITVPVVATLRPTKMMIFLAALLPKPGHSVQQQRQAEPEMMSPYHGGRDGLRDRFFHTCDPADAHWAMTLLRPQALRPFEEPTPLTAWPDVPAAYIVCGEDRACNPEWGRRAARERLGVTAMEILGSDHSPFLSRPGLVADLLAELASKGSS